MIGTAEQYFSSLERTYDETSLNCFPLVNYSFFLLKRLARTYILNLQ